ncbi:MAG: TRAP transporter small permease subunit [Bacillota bacterium]|jgi:TRAP-type C4-dicarboxylate transport system permease small subunit
MKPEKLIDFGIPIICGTLLMTIVTVTFLQIVLRNFCNFGLPWYDDVSQFSMSWMVLFSSIYLTKNDQHLNTGLKLHQKLNKWQICLIDGVLALAISSIAVVITYQTAMFAFSAMSIEALALPWIKMGVVFIMLPIAMLSVFYYYIKNFLKNFGFIFKKN